MTGEPRSNSTSETQPPDQPSPPGGEEIAPGVRVPRGAIAIHFARSGGPGGQNVNKLNTKADLRVHPADIVGMRPAATQRLIPFAGKRVTSTGEIHLTAETARTQEGNRAAVMAALRELIVRAMHRPKVRRKT